MKENLRRSFGWCKMRYLLVAITLLALSTSARAADSWTCTYTLQNDKPEFLHFALSPPDLVETALYGHYRILENNNYGVIAASSISEIKQGEVSPTVGAITVVINKGSGEFWMASAIAGVDAAVNQPVHGQCRNN